MRMQLDEFSEVKREFDVRMARAKALAELSSSKQRKKSGADVQTSGNPTHGWS